MKRFNVYGYKNGRFLLGVDQQEINQDGENVYTDYSFEYDISKYNAKNYRNAEGKLIARTYKGFRNYLGIVPGSALANLLVNELHNVPKKVLSA